MLQNERHPHESLSTRLRVLGGFEVDVTIEVQTEYVTYSFRAYPVGPMPSTVSDDPIRDLGLAFSALDELLQRDFASDRDANAAINAIYEVAWAAIFRALRIECLLTSACPATLADSKPHPPDEPPGELFCEFRGLILRTQFLDKPPASGTSDSDVVDSLQRTLDAELKRTVDLRQPATQYTQSLAGAKFVPGAPKQGEHIGPALVAYVNSRPNFFSRLIGFRSDDVMRPNYAGNAVLCHMFDGFALYGSMLGADTKQSKRLRYFLVYGGPSRHQLSRLLHRLHSAGEARHAALFDYDGLRDASDEIRRLDLAIDDDLVRGNGQTPASARTLRDGVDGIRAISKSVPGGLAYRVSRSAYYDETLSQRIDELNVGSIPGWQTYTGFINQNLWHHYRNIQSIGARYIAVQKKVRLLDGIVAEERNAEQQKSLVDLQKTAEVIGVLAAIYYGGHIISQFFQFVNSVAGTEHRVQVCSESWAKALNICIEDEHVRELASDLGGFGVVTVLSASFFFVRWLRGKRR